MAGLKKGMAALVAIMVLPALGWKASAQYATSLSLGSFHSPKGIGLCLETQQEASFFDSYNIIADMFGVLRGGLFHSGHKSHVLPQHHHKAQARYQP